MNTFMQTTGKMAVMCCAVLFSAAVFGARPDGVGGGGGGGGGGGNRPPSGEEAQGNNLSFPALPVDGYTIGPIPSTQFTIPYDGEYPGLTAEEIEALQASGPWYPQKTEGNTWQADNVPAGSETVFVSYVDWGDNIEAVNPKVRRPFRLEIQLYKQLNEWVDFNDDPESGNGMTGYVMAELEYPSSADELQGTDSTMYEGNFANVVSNLWKLRIQYCGDGIPDDLDWNATTGIWDSATPCTDVPVSFAVELNVGGKLIFGGSQGGWKPRDTGFYRITFYGPGDSYLSLEEAVVGNLAEFSVAPEAPADVPALASAESESEEGDEGAATPVVDGGRNISYVDVEVVGGGGGSKKPKSNNGMKK